MPRTAHDPPATVESLQRVRARVFARMDELGAELDQLWEEAETLTVRIREAYRGKPGPEPEADQVVEDEPLADPAPKPSDGPVEAFRARAAEIEAEDRATAVEDAPKAPRKPRKKPPPEPEPEGPATFVVWTKHKTHMVYFIRAKTLRKAVEYDRARHPDGRHKVEVWTGPMPAWASATGWTVDVAAEEVPA